MCTIVLNKNTFNKIYMKVSIYGHILVNFWFVVFLYDIMYIIK